MSRTTVRLNDELEARAKQRAAKLDMTFTQFVEDAILEKLTQPVPAESRPALVLPSFGDSAHRVGEQQLKAAREAADLEFDLKKIGRDPDAGD